MNIKIGYVIKIKNSTMYKFIVPFWKKTLKYKNLQLKIKSNFFNDSRKEFLQNFIVLVRFNCKQKKYNLIKILF
ncbi:ribosomal protein S17 (apicoplast) [Besnoitia besnoiti]|uniref:Ribosomal protein S17 n=1 Tax=Besnoitia besnoiti TaxID=94643 RepID=A0A2A9M4R3_BESBE|nr:ribosomal protein S17 [Besnoitia besnoiti]PFH30597.1 ribosomal protein S17 [Besnoitia besnoiti]